MMNTSSLERLLNLFWLRPETALWRTLDIESMREFEFISPSLDIGCGDGYFSFMRAGGAFSTSFDAFRSMGSMEHFFLKADVFNHCDEAYSPSIIKKPSYQIDYAFDHKKALLQKAGALGLYKNLVEGDANDYLPFEDGQFKSVFSNIIYWLDDPEKIFREICRILQPGGTACFMLPNTTFPEFSFFNSLYIDANNNDFAFLENLDRGRMQEIKQAMSHEEWGKLIDRSGLKVLSHGMHLSKTVIQMWDIGLRPLFPALLKMTNAIDEKLLLDVKSEWIEIFKMLLEPIVQLDAELMQGEEPAFHCYIVEKP